MSWHGLGLISQSKAPLGQINSAWFAPVLRPGRQWTGAPGSGFASLPEDPVRTTAKAALHLLVPPQRFTDTLDVGALAMANEHGSLANTLGIAKVIFHYEGSRTEITEPSWRTINTLRGPRTYLGWWVRLSARTAGNADLYIEAVPRDPAVQRRVIGPFFFDPVSELYTHSVTVAPSLPEVAGENYHTIDDAIAYVNSFGAASPNPLITITEAGLYDITRTSGTLMTDARGYCNITASVPDVWLGKTAFINDLSAQMQPGRYKLHLFGTNLGMDMRFVTFLQGTTQDEGRNHWLDGITMTTSGPDGQNTLWRGSAQLRSTTVRSFPWATEVDFIKLRNPSRNYKLVRGCKYDQIGADVANETRCFVFSTITNQSAKPQNIEIDAFTVTYTGAEVTATLACPGGLHASGGGGLFTLTLGSNVHTFDVGSPGGNDSYFLGTASYRGVSGVGGYWHQDVIDWLNSFPGVTAVRQIAPDRHAGYTTLPGTVGVGFAAQNIKDTTLQLASIINTHGDVYQHNGGLLENIIFAFNYGSNLEGQIIFLSPTGSAGPAPEHDVFIVGNAMSLGTKPSTYFNPQNASSQFLRGNAGHSFSHVVIAHNTFPNQGFLIRTAGVALGTTVDQYCIFKNNVMRRFQYDGVQPFLDNLTVDGLLIHGNELVPPNATNVICAGTQESIVQDFVGGDYRPAGPVLEAGFAPAIPFDLTREKMPDMAALGAYAVAAPAYALPPLSPTPEADLLAALNAVSGGQSFFLDFKQAVLAGGTMTVPDLSANGNNAAQSDASRLPTLSANGAIFASNNFVTMPISGGTFMFIVAFAKNDASTSGTIISDENLNNMGAFYQSGTTSSMPMNVFVDGQAAYTRDRWHNLMQGAGEVIIVIDDFPLTSSGELRIGRPSGALTGEVRRVIGINQADFADMGQMRSLAVQAAAIGYEKPQLPDPDASIIAMVNDAGGKSGVFDFTSGVTDSGTLTAADLSDNANILTQTAAARKPAIVAGGLHFAGDDFLTLPVTGGTFTFVLALIKEDTASSGTIISNNGAGSNFQYQQGGITTIQASVTVNGANVVNRGDLYNALHQTGERILTGRGVDYTGQTEIRLGGRGTSGGHQGIIRRAVILEHAAYGSGLANAVAAAQRWVAEV